MHETVGQRHLLRTALRRFWPVALLAALASGLVSSWLVERVSQTTYTADATYVVPVAPEPVEPAPGEPAPPVSTLPTSPFDAERLAKTYTLILAEDQQLLQGLSQATGVPVVDLRENVVAENVPSSAAVRVTYTSTDPADVEAYFTALHSSLSTTSLTPNIPVGNLQALRLPTGTVVSAGLAPLAPVVALVVGLLIGLGGAVLLERLDGRVRTSGDLRALATWPVFSLENGAEQSRLETVVLRTLGSGSSVREVAVATVDGPAKDADADAVEMLSRTDAALRRSGRLLADTPVSWRPVGALTTDGRAERGALDAGAVVLFVTRGARLKDTTSAVRSLQDIGAGSVVVLLDERRTGRRASGDSQDGGRPARASGARHRSDRQLVGASSPDHAVSAQQ